MSVLYGFVVTVIRDEKAHVVYSLYDTTGAKDAQTLREFATFGVVEIAERCERDKRVHVLSNECGAILFTVLVRSDGVGVGLVSTQAFSRTTAAYMLRRALQVYDEKATLSRDLPPHVPELKELFDHFKNPAAELTKAQVLQMQLDESTEQMSLFLANLMKKGENIEDIARRSDVLSEHAKRYFKRSKKTRRCLGRCPLV